MNSSKPYNEFSELVGVPKCGRTMMRPSMRISTLSYSQMEIFCL